MTGSAILLQRADDTAALPGLEPIADRIGRGLRSLLADLGHSEVQLIRQPTQMMPFAQWRAEHAELIATCSFRLKPIKGNVLLAFDPAYVTQLVDLFYGGTGAAANTSGIVTAAEQRCLNRIGEGCVPIIDASWAEAVPVASAFTGSSPFAAKDNDLFVIQSFSITGGSVAAMLYPLAALRPIAALSQSGDVATDHLVDSAWQARMAATAMNIRLPLRTIFARPELPLARLLALKPGDVIPLALPHHIPVTVAGRLFAQASIGESKGRAAIRIEEIVEGSTCYE